MKAAVTPADGNWLYYVNGDAAGHLVFFTDTRTSSPRPSRSATTTTGVVRRHDARGRAGPPGRPFALAGPAPRRLRRPGPGLDVRRDRLRGRRPARGARGPSRLGRLLLHDAAQAGRARGRRRGRRLRPADRRGQHADTDRRRSVAGRAHRRRRPGGRAGRSGTCGRPRPCVLGAGGTAQNALAALALDRPGAGSTCSCANRPARPNCRATAERLDLAVTVAVLTPDAAAPRTPTWWCRPCRSVPPTRSPREPGDRPRPCSTSSTTRGRPRSPRPSRAPAAAVVSGALDAVAPGARPRSALMTDRDGSARRHAGRAARGGARSAGPTPRLAGWGR